jgi:hypothetical protein
MSALTLQDAENYLNSVLALRGGRYKQAEDPPPAAAEPPATTPSPPPPPTFPLDKTDGFGVNDFLAAIGNPYYTHPADQKPTISPAFAAMQGGLWGGGLGLGLGAAQSYLDPEKRKRWLLNTLTGGLIGTGFGAGTGAAIGAASGLRSQHKDENKDTQTPGSNPHNYAEFLLEQIYPKEGSPDWSPGANLTRAMGGDPSVPSSHSRMAAGTLDTAGSAVAGYSLGRMIDNFRHAYKIDQAAINHARNQLGSIKDVSKLVVDSLPDNVRKTLEKHAPKGELQKLDAGLRKTIDEQLGKIRFRGGVGDKATKPEDGQFYMSGLSRLLSPFTRYGANAVDAAKFQLSGLEDQLSRVAGIAQHEQDLATLRSDIDKNEKALTAAKAKGVQVHPKLQIAVDEAKTRLANKERMIPARRDPRVLKPDAVKIMGKLTGDSSGNAGMARALAKKPVAGGRIGGVAGAVLPTLIDLLLRKQSIPTQPAPTTQGGKS